MHVVSGKLRKPPFIKDGVGQGGESKMYAIELSEMTKDWQTQEKTYTNYKALFFAKTEGAKAYYDKAFSEGSFVVVTSEKLKVEVSDCGQYIKLNLDNARLESAMFDDNNQQQGQQQHQGYGNPQQPNNGQYYQQQQQQQPAPRQQYNEPPMDFDEDIPF